MEVRGRPLVPLPPKTEKSIEVKLSENEDVLYKELWSSCVAEVQNGGKPV